ncbi:hypothetical protein CXG81DRAFT_29223 [Caulochytrium protostelioides]|uniref:Serine hydroxymethyltransferase n=1 Tax=Caulochytrium protostelioides TaxID=1555241 RepID=A0A4P9XDU9_9FUNG|nr:hypothetical protein CXG81DRAFT_29223 [Caulochytrium protostelioides]|eukprot:RKP03658.1 hypothetical protein CXG81DRAFT_29223 [Caulochytrium protostelioides]
MGRTLARPILAHATPVAGLPRGLNAPLRTVDPALYEIIEREKHRQRYSLNLIPSENCTSRAVMDALGSVMQNKYSEGYPGARYYGGNRYIDAAERLCQERALAAFGLDADRWGVNVQPLSGSPANLYVYGALLKPHDRIMGLDLPHGGHLSHGYQTPTKKISYVSQYYETMPYRCDETTGRIDYDAAANLAAQFRPKVLVAGSSAYVRTYDYPRMRQIADQCGAYLLADMAHISGMVAAGVLPSPFEHADVVTTTTHKSLRGPRGAMIFYRKGVRSTHPKTGEPVKYELESAIQHSVFPGHQGGPHNHTITALAVALAQAQQPEYRRYQQQVLDNAQRLAAALQARGHKLVTDGTDTHLVLLDLRPLAAAGRRVDGARAERVLELVNIAANKNTVPGDTNALVPHGVRMGTPAMTTRGFDAAAFDQVAAFVDEAITLAAEINAQLRAAAAKDGRPVPKLRDFMAALGAEGDAYPQIADLRERVAAFAAAYPTVGFTEAEMAYP